MNHITRQATEEAPGGTTRTVESESLSSVEIAQNAKGEPRVTVKAYAPNIQDAGGQALAEYQRMISTLGNQA